ncbi:MAG: alpha/beta hydrolase [Aureispira sp.]
MPSFSSKLVHVILRLKGIKNSFSQDPMLYRKLRKDDINSPSKRLLKGTTARSFTLMKSTITELVPSKTPRSSYLLLFCPGGAFVSGPNSTVWPSLVTLVKNTGITGWMVNYPKAPEHQLPEIASNIDAIYAKALEEYPPERILLIGDSAGAQLVLTLTQRLLAKGLSLPQRIIVVSPIMDMSVDNPAIAAIDLLDPILSEVGVRSANTMAAGEADLKAPELSPLFGNFKGFPPIDLFLAEHDIFYPDSLLGIAKMKAAEVEVNVIVGKEMMHDWPYMPFMKEATEALGQIEEIIAVSMTDL